MSNLVETLVRRFGMYHRISLVGRHTSSGVEGSNSIIAVHLRALCTDPRLTAKWGSPQVLKLMEYNINDMVCSETGVRRFDAMFGTNAGRYAKPIDQTIPGETARAKTYLQQLDRNLEAIHQIMRTTNDEVIRKRSNGVTELTQDKFLAGELVLLQHDKDKVAKETKLTMPFSGPYVVIKQEGNDVCCRHLASGIVDRHEVTRLKMFWGTERAAKEAANLDADGHTIARLKGWKGDVEIRTTMQFHTVFSDGEEQWLNWDDEQETIQFQTFCESKDCLKVLLRTVGKLSREFVKSIMSRPIQTLYSGNKIFVDIRCYGCQWYDESLTFLEDRYEKVYVVEYEVLEVFTHAISARCDVYNEMWPVTRSKSNPGALNAYWIYAWTHRSFDDKTMMLVTREMCARNPVLISLDPERQREALGRRK
jgi:hypothetical protein